MRDVLFVQGAGRDVHATWDQRLVESLRRELGAGYAVRYPRMPNEADPDAAAWRAVLVRELAALRPGAIAVGHSVGGTVLLAALADAAPIDTLDAIVLIAAPFVGDGGLGARLPAGVPVLLYHGEDDAVVPVAHVERHAESIPQARVRRLAGRDPQLNDDLADVARDIHRLAPTAGAS